MKSLLLSFLSLVLSESIGAEPLIEGRVRLDSGEPVADAQVRLFDMTDLQRGAIARALTDGTGYFALPWAALTGRALPERFTLGPNYPNPFNPSTIIPYQLAASSAVRLEVFNLLGQHIATLVDGARPAGFHTATWHATDGAGRAVGAGVYIYRMTVGAASQTGRMVLLDGQAGVSSAGAASDWLGADGGGEPAKEQVYGLIVSGEGLVPYVDSAFRVESGMAPVELVVSSGVHSAGKATDDDCALCGFLGESNDSEDEEDETTEEEAKPDSTAVPGADLVVQMPSGDSSSLTPGQFFSLVVFVRNQGDSPAVATTLTYYRSINETISASDTEVGTDAVDALAAGISIKSIRLAAPSSAGTYYYGACVASVAGESNTDNNCSDSRAVTVRSVSNPVTIPDAQLRAVIAAELGKASGATIYKSEMETLTDLAAADAGISDLTGLESAINLLRLELGRNNISNLSPLRGLTNLTRLGLYDNEITDIKPLRGLTNLLRLELGRNNISDVSPLRGLTNLHELNLDTNNISDVSPLRGLTNLTRLELYGNEITDLSPIAGLTNLTWLWLGRNNISDVSPLRGLTNLTGLELYGNEITDLSPLRGLTNLHELDLGRNNISDVSPLRGLTNLHELELDFNNISDVSPLRGLTNLIELELWGNLLNSSSINDHIPALKRSGATVFFDSFREGSDFDIELVFLSSFTEPQKRIVQYAARRWMSIIREDLPDYTFASGWSGGCGGLSYAIPSGERIDDLRIYVISHDDDPDYDWTGIAGWGGVRVSRETSHLPVVGCMAFNLDDNYIALDTALHEIGHVLGIGQMPWYNNGFVQESPGDVHFNGPRAIAAFDAAGGRNYTGKKVPLEEDWSHWRASVLTRELMEPSGGDGRTLSAITIQSLADLGYSVDVTQADPYTLPRAAAKVVAAGSTPDDRLPGRRAPHRTCGTGQQREPVYVVDPQGRVVRTISP